VLPVAAQLVRAVGHLHELGVAHRDLSLENAVLSAGPSPDSPPMVKLIDFGMSALGRMQGTGASRTVVGKRTYCAPEVRRPGAFDAYLADAFSVGVMLFGMTMRGFPWQSTVPGVSASLEHAKKVGMAAHLAMMRISGHGAMKQVSHDLEDLLAGLLEPHPAARMSLGEACFLQEGRRSALNSGWLRAACAGTAAPGLGVDDRIITSKESGRALCESVGSGSTTSGDSPSAQPSSSDSDDGMADDSICTEGGEVSEVTK